MVLYSKNDAAAEKDIELLEQLRADIYSKLDAFHKALKELERKETPEIEKYLFEQDRKKVLVMALETWFELEEIKLDINLNMAADSIRLSDPIKNFMAAWENIQHISNDPAKYWVTAKQKFKPLPVTKEEKELIKKRYEVYIRDEGDIEMVNFLVNFTKAINFANDKFNAGVSIAKLHEYAPWLVPLISQSSYINTTGYKRMELNVKGELFFLRLNDYTAFDER